MIHHDRVYGVEDVRDVKTLANKLFHYTWTGCTGYQLGEYLFLNDSFDLNGIQEFAVLKIEDGELIHIETIAISNWSFKEHHLELVLIAAMESKKNRGAYNDLQLEDAKGHKCDLCR